jgi:NDP-sugar pyrophosphorylase family protein
MKAVVLAAGKGIRLRPLTEKKPKALVELRGRPLIEHVLESLQEAGIEETTIVLGYLGRKIQKRLGKSFGGMPLKYARQESQLGTANAVASAEEAVAGNSFICSYADVIAESGIFSELVQRFGEKRGSVFAKAVEKPEQKVDAVVVGRRVRDPWRFGVLKTEGGKVLDIIEKPLIGEQPGNIINTGIYWFSPKIFEAIRRTGKSIRGEFEITDSLREIAKEGRLGFVEYNGKCFDISSVTDLEEAEQLLKGKNK